MVAGENCSIDFVGFCLTMHCSRNVLGVRGLKHELMVLRYSAQRANVRRHSIFRAPETVAKKVMFNLKLVKAMQKVIAH